MGEEPLATSYLIKVRAGKTKFLRGLKPEVFSNDLRHD
jgi:hypothetical protein